MARTTALALLALVGCGSPEEPPAPVEVAPVVEVEPEPVVEPEPAPEVVVPSTHDLLFLVLHDQPLLPSEERLLGVQEARLDRRNDVERRDATEEEAAFAAIFFDGTPDARLEAVFPETFGRASQVLFLRVAPPRTRSDGELLSRGFTGVLLFRPPDLEPAFEERIDEASSWRFADDTWSGWLSGLLRDPEGA